MSFRKEGEFFPAGRHYLKSGNRRDDLLLSPLEKDAADLVFTESFCFEKKAVGGRDLSLLIEP